jgi:hypothetical protein
MLKVGPSPIFSELDIDSRVSREPWISFFLLLEKWRVIVPFFVDPPPYI